MATGGSASKRTRVGDGPQPDRPTMGTVANRPSPAFDGWREHADVVGATRVALLKALESITANAFTAEVIDADPDAERRRLLHQVVFQSNMAGIPENSELFYSLLEAKCQRMVWCRELVVEALSTLGDDSGFDQWERALITGCAGISTAYDSYFFAYQRAMNDPTVVAALADSSDSTTASRSSCPELLSPYTVVRASQTADGYAFSTEPYAIFFAAVLPPIFAAFDACVESITSVSGGTEGDRAAMATFLRQFRAALGETDPAKLEPAWAKCDELWMDVQGPIQVVHDIEDGYSDPLRAKQGPDFSVRFLDSTFDAQNATIAEIQGYICEYYKGRGTALSRDGLAALSNTSAGIYYIPFKTGCSLVFSYSGQSIPNRLDVKKEKGVKIYFDAIETAARVKQVAAKVLTLFEEAQTEVLDRFQPDAVEQLVWHVAAHEVGHAIYGVKSMEDFVAKETVTLLEEPRAELTAMFTLRLLHQRGRVALTDLQKYLVHFLLDATRYFAKFHSQPLQPYIIFQIHAFNVYFKHGLLTTTGEGKLKLHPEATLSVLDDFAETFERVLAAIDRHDAEGGAVLEAVVQEMRKPSAQTEAVVELCLA